MTIAPFRSFQSTVTPLRPSRIDPSLRLLSDPVTGAPAGIQSPNAGGPNGIWVPVDLTPAQILAPTAEMLADLNATYRRNVAPYDRLYSDGTQLVAFFAGDGPVTFTNANGSSVTLSSPASNAGLDLTINPDLIYAVYDDNGLNIRNMTILKSGSLTGAITTQTAAFTASIDALGVMTVTAFSAGDGNIQPGMIILRGTQPFIISFQASGSTGSTGVYSVLPRRTAVISNTFTGSVGLLTVSATASGTPGVGNVIVGASGSTIDAQTRITALGTYAAGVGTLFVTPTSSATSQVMYFGTQYGNDSIRLMTRDSHELGAFFTFPQQNGDIGVGLGSLIQNDFYGRGLILGLNYTTTNNTGPLPDGYGCNIFYASPTGDIKLISAQDSSNFGINKQVVRFEMYGGGNALDATMGNIAIGASDPGNALAHLLPLWPLHIQSAKQLTLDSTRIGTHTLWLVDNGTAQIGTVDGQIDFKTGSNTPGSATTRMSVTNTSGLRLPVALTPASAVAAGTTGDIAWDTGFLYVATGTNTWKRVAIATW